MAKMSTAARSSGAVRLLAYHEAGHAVAAYLLKRPLAAISLRQTDPEPTPPPAESSPLALEEAERDVVVLLAGVEAEAILTGDCDWYTATADRERAEALLAWMLAEGYRAQPRDEHEAELAGTLSGDAARCAWEILRHRAQALLQQSPARSAIAALAAALLTAETLDPQQAQRAIRQGVAAADPDLS